jgi:hypothetical protein
VGASRSGAPSSSDEDCSSQAKRSQPDIHGAAQAVATTIEVEVSFITLSSSPFFAVFMALLLTFGFHGSEAIVVCAVREEGEEGEMLMEKEKSRD